MSAGNVDSARVASEAPSVADTVESPAQVTVAVVDPRQEESGITERAVETGGRWACIFPEDALRYLRDNRESPEKVPILQEARAEGLWPRR